MNGSVFYSMHQQYHLHLIFLLISVVIKSKQITIMYLSTQSHFQQLFYIGFSGRGI